MKQQRTSAQKIDIIATSGVQQQHQYYTTERKIPTLPIQQSIVEREERTKRYGVFVAGVVFSSSSSNKECFRTESTSTYC
jgi:hypothetical protein